MRNFFGGWDISIDLRLLFSNDDEYLSSKCLMSADTFIVLIWDIDMMCYSVMVAKIR